MRVKIYVFFTLVLSAFFAFSCQKNKGDFPVEGSGKQEVVSRFSFVSAEEYKKATDSEKGLYDKLNAAVAALEMLGDKSYQATIMVKNSGLYDEFFANSIIISKESVSEMRGEKRSCRACGLSSGAKCVKKLLKVMKDEDEFDVHVKRDGDCYILTW